MDPSRFGSWFSISTNYNNKFAFDLNPSIAILNEPKRMSYGFYIGPRYRFNDRLVLNSDFNFSVKTITKVMLTVVHKTKLYHPIL
nr:DUF5916 domain-containing protein [uncultured Flavobacterium sp.]